MSNDRPEIHQKILSFLLTEWNRQDNRQLVGVDLLFRPGNGYKDEEIRRWERADEADFFAEIGNVEKLVTTILEIAEGEADAKPAGKHTFMIRARQHMGSRPNMSFALQPSFTGEPTDTSLVAPGGAGGPRSTDVALAQILSGNNSQLMRINAQMFDSAFRPLAQQNAQLLNELISTRAENAELQRKLVDAESNKLDREFQIAMAASKDARANATVQKLFQLGTVVAAKFASGTQAAGQIGEASPLSMMMGELWTSLRDDQRNGIMHMLDMSQKILFMEIINKVKPPDQYPPPPGPAGPGPAGPGGVNGAPG